LARKRTAGAHAIAALRNEFSGLDSVESRECKRDVIEGTHQTGKGSVVQVLAKRH
jgi:hypothetical protein